MPFFATPIDGVQKNKRWLVGRMMICCKHR